MDESSEDDSDADEVMNSENEGFEDEEETAKDIWGRMFYNSKIWRHQTKMMVNENWCRIKHQVHQPK